MGLDRYLKDYRVIRSQLRQARATPSPIVFLNRRWGHHGRHSGYLIDLGVGENLGRDECILPVPLARMMVKCGGHAHVNHRVTTRLYLQAFGARLMHLIDGDFDTWAYSPPISSKVRTTATFHQPIDKLPEITAPLKAGLLDGIVCVSRNQIPLVQHLVPAGRCVFIPHGVDTQFFCPGSGGIGGDVSPTEPMVLTVGSHRRDFATLVATAKLVHAVRRDVKFILIGPREKVGHVEAASGGIIKVLSGVSDQELCDAYRRAAVVLLPLEEATANNSLLEGAACGRPIVVSDLPAITDYVEGDQVLRAPVADAKAHADATLRILSDASLARRLGQGAYETVQSYAWPLVNDRARAFFQSVIDG